MTHETIGALAAAFTFSLLILGVSAAVMN